LQGYIERGEIAGIVALIHRHGEEAHVEVSPGKRNSRN
jgi:hypothetical protein